MKLFAFVAFLGSWIIAVYVCLLFDSLPQNLSGFILLLGLSFYILSIFACIASFITINIRFAKNLQLQNTKLGRAYFKITGLLSLVTLCFLLLSFFFIVLMPGWDIGTSAVLAIFIRIIVPCFLISVFSLSLILILKFIKAPNKSRTSQLQGCTTKKKDNDNRNFICVLKTGKTPEHDIAANALQENGIPFYKEQEICIGLRTAMPFPSSKEPDTYYYILVPEQAAEDARSILNELPIDITTEPDLWHFNPSKKTMRFWKVFIWSILGITLLFLIYNV